MDGWMGRYAVNQASFSFSFFFLVGGCERERKEKRGGSSLKGVGLDAVGVFMSKWEWLADTG